MLSVFRSYAFRGLSGVTGQRQTQLSLQGTTTERSMWSSQESKKQSNYISVSTLLLNPKPYEPHKPYKTSTGCSSSAPPGEEQLSAGLDCDTGSSA